MKNLFLICTMLLCFGYASAQETPQKTKQSKTKTDTVYSKKSKHTVEKSSTTHKTDTLKGNRTHKKGKTTKSSGTETIPNRKDSVN